MAVTLLSEWIRWIWIAVYAVIVVLHLFHAQERNGQGRAWHFGHVIMALGMVYMFMPSYLKVIPDSMWEVVFAAAAVVIFGWLLRAWTSQRAVNFLWALSLLDMVAMVYMFRLPKTTIVLLTAFLVIYFAGMAIAWLSGKFDNDDRQDGPIPLALNPRPPSTAVTTLAGETSVESRTSLAAMSAGMAYMFIAMQAGM